MKPLLPLVPRVCVVLVFLAAPVLGQPARESGFRSIHVTAKRVDPVRRTIGFDKLSYDSGRPQWVYDAVVVDRDCLITLDGLPARLESIRSGYRVTLTYNPRTGVVRAVEALSPEAQARTEAKTRRDEQETSVNLRALEMEVRALEEKQQRQRLAAQQRHLAALHAARLKAIQDLRQLQQQHPSASGAGTSSRPNPFLRGVKEVASLAFIGYSNYAYHELGKSTRLSDVLASKLWKTSRDVSLALYIESHFPDLGQEDRADLTRLVTLFLDGRLTLGNFQEQRLEDEVREILSRECPKLNATYGVVKFIVEVRETLARNRGERSP